MMDEDKLHNTIEDYDILFSKYCEIKRENELLNKDNIELLKRMKLDVSEHYKEFMQDYDVLLEEYEQLLNENKKLKEIIKDNFDYFEDNKKVFFNYNLPVMEKEILEVLEDDK